MGGFHSHCSGLPAVVVWQGILEVPLQEVQETERGTCVGTMRRKCDPALVELLIETVSVVQVLYFQDPLQKVGGSGKEQRFSSWICLSLPERCCPS